MARQESRQVEEDSAPGAPAWMTTFSDCMTLLLTFFVLLLTFSSFDINALSRLFGALNAVASPSARDRKHKVDESLAAEEEPVVDRTAKGAEKFTDESPDMTRSPKHREAIARREAYCEEKMLRIPSKRLFLGQGRVLTRRGRDYLGQIAAFMKKVPCQAIISEVRPAGPSPAQAPDARGGLARSWTVVRFFTRDGGLPGSRFSISAPMRSAGPASIDEPCIQIVLLTEDVKG